MFPFGSFFPRVSFFLSCFLVSRSCTGTSDFVRAPGFCLPLLYSYLLLPVQFHGSSARSARSSVRPHVGPFPHLRYSCRVSEEGHAPCVERERKRISFSGIGVNCSRVYKLGCMASPEVVESSGILLPGFHEETFEIEGWKKKLILKKGGTPKKKDVIYVAPDGEEIRNKRQLEKYLKNHPGGPSVADFDWSTGETPRRSARLSSKGRLSSDNAEEGPAFKRSKSDQDEDPVIVVSPRKSSRRKPGPRVGKEEVTEDSEKREEVDSIGAEGLIADSSIVSDGKLADENVLARVEEPLQNNTDGKHGQEGITGTSEELNVGEPAEQVPPTEVVTGVGNSAHQVNEEGQASKIEEPLTVPDTVMEEVAIVEEAVNPGHPGATYTEESAVTEVVQPTDGETSLKGTEDVKEAVSQDSLAVPPTQHLDGTDDDPLKPRDNIESHGIHALMEEPILSGVIKSPEQQTDHPLPAAPERVGVST